MAVGAVPKVLRLKAIRPGVTQVAFDTGEVREIEWKRYAKPGTVFEPLSDPEFASKARKVNGGFAVGWPGGLDWSAGGLIAVGRAVKGDGVEVSLPHAATRKIAARPAAGQSIASHSKRRVASTVKLIQKAAVSKRK